MEDEFCIYITEDSFVVETSTNIFKNEIYKQLFQYYEENSNVFLFELSFVDTIDGTAAISFLQRIAKVFLKNITHYEGLRFGEKELPIISEVDIDRLIDDVPMFTGHEFITRDWIKGQNLAYNRVFLTKASDSGKQLVDFLHSRGESIIIPSRVYFHLVENRMGEEFPFAFLATYTALNGKLISHFPLKNALSEFKDNPTALKELIQCIRKASQKSEFVHKHLESGEIYFPIKIDDKDAYEFLKEVSICEDCGIICRIPKWFTDSASCIQYDINEKQIFAFNVLNARSLNIFSPQMVYKGCEITEEEVKILLSKAEGLEIIKGRWIEVNHLELLQLLEQYKELSSEGTTLRELFGLRMESSAQKKAPFFPIVFSRQDWITKLKQLIIQEGKKEDLPSNMLNVLRAYQKDAFFWMWKMYLMRFGVCLADDMGLGKTIEIIAFLEKLKENSVGSILIIVPATLIPNWKSELCKFAPSLDYFIIKGNNAPRDTECRAFITITSYQQALKLDYLNTVSWDVIILDEAQGIKNYYTSQSQKIKSLNGKMKIAMTGTPIENNALELWSIFDFLNPGLLGTKEEFLRLYTSGIDAHKIIKRHIQPFILRRLKTDKSIISDLPEKNEIEVKIQLSKEQIVLYRKVIDEMNNTLRCMQDKRRAANVVLVTINKLKQICNHPSQFLGKSEYPEEQSGKFLMLRNICETINAKKEKVIVFTQYKEVIPAIERLLETIFGKKGLVLHGDVSLPERERRINSFQAGESSFIVLSLKVGGVGLNLTAARNVIHFDRWWNPAVENQATDRVYRIGQKHNVNIFKFITDDTIEQAISIMVKEKIGLADELINGLDNRLTGLSIDELIKAVGYGGEYE